VIIDSWFDNYAGVVVLAGCWTARSGPAEVTFHGTGNSFEVQKVGVFSPHPEELQALGTGEVGFVIANIKELTETKWRHDHRHAPSNREAAPGFKVVRPMVFAASTPSLPTSIPAADGDRQASAQRLLVHCGAGELRGAWIGFRCGFLGLLHMEIVQERWSANTTCSSSPRLPRSGTRGEDRRFGAGSRQPARLRNRSSWTISRSRSSTPRFTSRRNTWETSSSFARSAGVQRQMKFVSAARVILEYELPLNEIVLDFYDKLKTASRGYASMDYDFLRFQPSNLVRLDILLNGTRWTPFAHRAPGQCLPKGRMSRSAFGNDSAQMFEVVIQAAIGGKVIARESVKAIRKNVIAKCYGGDISRSGAPGEAEGRKKR